MSRVSKFVLLALAVVAVLALGLFVGASVYLQSASTQKRVQEQLSQALGVPIQLTRLNFGLSQMQIYGVRIPQGEGALLEAPSFRASYQLLPLLRGRLEIGAIVLESPRVKWAQNEEGKWVLPLLPKKEKPEKIELPKTAPTPRPEKKKGVEVAIESMEIQNGQIELLDAQGLRAGMAYDVNMRYTLAQPGQVQGTLEAARVQWAEMYQFQNVRAKLAYAGGELRLQDVQAEVAGGRAEAQFTLQTEEKNSPFTGTLEVQRVDLATLSAEHGWAARQAEGRMSGRVQLQGTLKKPEKTTGTGSISMEEGRFAQLHLLQAVGTLLQIKELADLRVQQGRVDFKLADEKVELAPLVLESGDLRFTTTGTVGYNRKLDLQARLMAAAPVWQRLPEFITNNFDAPDAQNRRGIAFAVKGTTDKPRPDLVERVIGTKIGGQFEDLLGSIFASEAKKREEKERKKQQEKEEKERRKAEKKAKEKAGAAVPAPAPAEAPQP